MRFFKMGDGTAQEVPANTLRDAKEPFYFFLGGLLHLNGLELEGGLPVLLRTMTQGRRPIYTVALNDTPDISKTAGQADDYHKTRINTPEAEDIVSQLFIAPETGQVTSALHNARFIGYSYGTSLIQQIESVLRERLGIQAYKTLENVRCVNIGPVITPNVTTHQGHALPFERSMINAGTSIDPFGRFKQVFIFRTSDKVMGGFIGDALLDTKDTRPHIAYEAPHLVFIAENTGDAFIRRVGIGLYPSGYTTPRLDFALDSDGHSLRLYTNELAVTESNKGRFAIFPSSSLGPIIKDAIAAMDVGMPDWQKAASRWVAEGTPRAARLTHLRSYFSEVADGFQRNQFAQCFPYVEGVLTRVGAMVAVEQQDLRLDGPRTALGTVPVRKL